MGAIDLNQLLESQHLERSPFPIPVGWFYVDESENLKAGELRNVFLFGQEWVLFRTESGKPGMSDPYCPHLGAHMGHGGEVCGEHLRCPFHHWEYDTEGWCKVIPYAKLTPPIVKKQAILRTLPMVEKYGMLWAWYHPQCDEPTYELPYIPELEDATGYAGARAGSWTADTCIQEIAENGVDVAHLKFLHKAPIIPPVEAKYDGPLMKLNIGNGYIVGDIYGPGLNVMRFTKDGITCTMISYSVPVTKEKTTMNMKFRHVDYAEGTKELAISKGMIDHMIGAAEGEDSAGFESVDFIVWNHKKYRPNPLLCDGDGPIVTFRRWFRQFYPGFEGAQPKA
ncbi:Rieske 2Fe-2S domain-containing protein [Sinimarinibacterium sp. NLF-5-8]|uniref:Rieske 2Fe-2S domain-containing protein n=1 Tax=Sinimarinibacterium sp. NLF-5-8 TaxID=2698684 RepID=UPI00137C0BE3|nr:Rieske 2Fe-2S domain-containing protein [Sinimarinibacterium sp. NLF-5-8]QHS09804.1 Rieske (2Fe-2S) protein [Sinimarinibacterium sp. NLF-5-8]